MKSLSNEGCTHFHFGELAVGRKWVGTGEWAGCISGYHEIPNGGCGLLNNRLIGFHFMDFGHIFTSGEI